MRAIFVATVAGILVLSGCGSSGSSGSSSGLAPATGVAGLFSSSHPVTVPAGTIVVVRTSTALSTHTSRSGEVVGASLEAPLTVNGIVLAPQGAGATLLVADSNPGGRVKGKARLGLRLTNLAVAGVNQPVTSDIAWHQAHATKRKDAAKIGVLAGVGAAIGALAGGGKGAAIGAGAGAGAGTAVVLSTRGEAAVIPAESVIQFRLEQPLTVVVKG